MATGLIDSIAHQHILATAAHEALGAVAEGFGQPLSSLFESLEREPVAAASLAQVHRGLWRVDGGEARPVERRQAALRPGNKDGRAYCDCECRGGGCCDLGS